MCCDAATATPDPLASQGSVPRYRLAHLSDPHLAPLPRPPWTSLVSKRAFGYVNWVKNRGAALGRTTVDALTADMANAAPDHIAVTGDLVNIALAAEYTAAARWLQSLGAGDDVTVVPGNHDAYVPGALARATEAWRDNIRSDDGAVHFPLLRRRGPLAIIGLSTAIATPPAFATGTVGAAQRDIAARLLDENDDAIKVMLIHHPPDQTLAPGRRRLTDHAAVRDLIAEGGADVVLHGHTHEPSLTTIDTVRGPCAVIGVPSASSAGTKHPHASYLLLDWSDSDRTLRATRRGFAAQEKKVQHLETLDLSFMRR